MSDEPEDLLEKLRQSLVAARAARPQSRRPVGAARHREEITMSTVTTDDIRGGKAFTAAYAPEHGPLVTGLILDGFHTSGDELWRQGERGWAAVAFDDLHVYVRAYRIDAHAGGLVGEQLWHAVFVHAPSTVVRAAAAAVQ